MKYFYIYIFFGHKHRNIIKFVNFYEKICPSQIPHCLWQNLSSTNLEGFLYIYMICEVLFLFVYISKYQKNKLKKFILINPILLFNNNNKIKYYLFNPI